MNTSRLAFLRFFLFSLFLSLAFTPSSQAQQKSSTAENKFALREGWSLQTSSKVEAKGEVIDGEFRSQGMA